MTQPTHADPVPAHEDVDDVVTTDPGPQQSPGQGEDTPPQDAPEGEPGFS